ncbi:MAG: phage tail assembly chaperone [Bradyrhizobiaceae bacterium]|nr:phage tail assembly chaperone [Bradyrhizobiaceae bacterium]
MAPNSSAHSRESGNPEQHTHSPEALGPRFRGDERGVRKVPEPFPWQQALAIGLGVLRLSPEAFWKMTPREFAAALRGLYGDPAPPLDRVAFDALMARFPDGTAPHPSRRSATSS